MERYSGVNFGYLLSRVFFEATQRPEESRIEQVISSAGQMRSFSAFLRSCVRTHRLFRDARTQERKVFQRNASKRNAPPEILKRSSFCDVRTLLYREKNVPELEFVRCNKNSEPPDRQMSNDWPQLMVVSENCCQNVSVLINNKY